MKARIVTTLQGLAPAYAGHLATTARTLDAELVAVATPLLATTFRITSTGARFTVHASAALPDVVRSAQTADALRAQLTALGFVDEEAPALDAAATVALWRQAVDAFLTTSFRVVGAAALPPEAALLHGALAVSTAEGPATLGMDASSGALRYALTNARGTFLQTLLPARVRAPFVG